MEYFEVKPSSNTKPWRGVLLLAVSFDPFLPTNSSPLICSSPFLGAQNLSHIDDPMLNPDVMLLFFAHCLLGCENARMPSHDERGLQRRAPCCLPAPQSKAENDNAHWLSWGVYKFAQKTFKSPQTLMNVSWKGTILKRISSSNHPFSGDIRSFPGG